jgi:hypothetical protein
MREMIDDKGEIRSYINKGMFVGVGECCMIE